MKKSFSRSVPSCTDGIATWASGRSEASATSRSCSTQPNISTESWWEESRCWESVPITRSHRRWNSNPWTSRPMRWSGRPPTTQVHRSSFSGQTLASYIKTDYFMMTFTDTLLSLCFTRWRRCSGATGGQVQNGWDRRILQEDVLWVSESHGQKWWRFVICVLTTDVKSSRALQRH